MTDLLKSNRGGKFGPEMSSGSKEFTPNRTNSQKSINLSWEELADPGGEGCNAHPALALDHAHDAGALENAIYRQRIKKQARHTGNGMPCLP